MQWKSEAATIQVFKAFWAPSSGKAIIQHNNCRKLAIFGIFLSFLIFFLWANQLFLKFLLCSLKWRVNEANRFTSSRVICNRSILAWAKFRVFANFWPNPCIFCLKNCTFSGSTLKVLSNEVKKSMGSWTVFELWTFVLFFTSYQYEGNITDPPFSYSFYSSYSTEFKNMVFLKI